MKRFVCMMLFAVMLCFTACSKSYTVTDNPFPMEEQQMADIFSGYQLGYTVGERYIMREDRYGIAYGYEIDSFGEDQFNIYIYTGEERGRQLSYSPEWKKKNRCK